MGFQFRSGFMLIEHRVSSFSRVVVQHGGVGLRFGPEQKNLTCWDEDLWLIRASSDRFDGGLLFGVRPHGE